MTNNSNTNTNKSTNINNTYYIQCLIKLYFNGKLKAKYNIEKNRGQQTYSAQAIDYSKKSEATGKTNHISHEIEDYMAAKSESEQLASFLKLLIDEVEEALETLVSRNELDDGRVEMRYDDYNLLKWSYQRVPNYTDEQVADKLNMARRTLIDRRNTIFEELAKLINVDYYVNNPIKDVAEFFDDLIDG